MRHGAYSAPFVTRHMMNSTMTEIDVTFDFRTDTPPAKDPDAKSPALRRHHQLLWSKPLPDGTPFVLSTGVAGAYLHHRSPLGEFVLSSDTVIPSFTRAAQISHVIEQVPRAKRDRFNALGYTIGGMMVFPANKIGGKMTINGARGCHPRVKDRFDLTLECIRRFYCGTSSPLSDVLQRYRAFLGLFRTFGGYVDFFLLQDLVDPDYSGVQFMLPFEGFVAWPLPDSVASYLEYQANAEAFLARRNYRIAASASGMLST